MYKFTSLSRGRAVVARRAHNPKVAGSSPALATLKIRYSLFFKKLRIFLFSIGNKSYVFHLSNKKLNLSSTSNPNTGAWLLENGFSI